MTYVRLHAKDRSEIIQLVLIINLLEDLGGQNDLAGNNKGLQNEHRHAGVKDEGENGKTQFIDTPLPLSLLKAHFDQTGAAQTDIKKGELHLTYAAQGQPYQALLAQLKTTQICPNAQPF